MSDLESLGKQQPFEVLQDLAIRDRIMVCEMCGRTDLEHIQFRFWNLRGALCRSCVRFIEGLAWHQMRSLGR